jgi:YD repeat-containing protein
MSPAGKLIATMTALEYASGVIAAELAPNSSNWLRVELGAAVLRYLKQTPRHGEADVCDSTHCAWFIGRGPRMEWLTPQLAKETGQFAEPMDSSLWMAAQSRSQSPGPSFWTSHCGGKPLSPYAVWGSGSAEATACQRHQQPAHRWERAWDRAKIEKTLGGQITSAQIVWPKGQWTLRIETSGRTRDFNYDSAHRLIAPIAGWDGLPSPAESIWLSGTKIHLQGFGSGHRVGLCLGD